MEYQPIDSNRGDIRLLRLATHADQREDEPLRCTLEHANLFQSESYVALSYVWGDQLDTVEILLGEHTFTATRNLEKALRSLQARGFTLVWADAVCINQKDAHERMQQVLRMGAIYQTAQSTQAWMPTATEGEQGDVLASIRSLHRPGGAPVSDSRRRSVIERFFGNTYFQRVWIVQELALGRGVELTYGSEIIALGELYDLMDRVTSAGRWPPWALTSQAFTHATRLKQLGGKAAAYASIELVEAMQVSAGCGATDERDRVYGLLGLVTNAQRYVSVPSYFITVSELCLGITRSYIQKTESLDVIAMLASGSSSQDFPSWLPRWCSSQTFTASSRGCNYLQAYPTDRGYRPGVIRIRTKRLQVWQGRRCRFQKWSAARDSRPRFNLLERNSVLQVKGRMLGDISAYTATLSEDVPVTKTTGELPAEALNGRHLFRALHSLLTLGLEEETAAYYYADTVVLQRGFPRQTPVFSSVQAFSRLHARRLVGYDLRTLHPTLNLWFARNAAFRIGGTSLTSATGLHQLGLLQYYLLNGPGPLELYRLDWRRGRSEVAFVLYIFFLSPILIPLVLMWMSLMCCVREGKTRLSQPPEELCRRIEDVLQLEMRLAYGSFGIGWVDGKTREGDSVAILAGCSVPVILRPRAEGGWILIGDAIVYGAMLGQHMDESTFTDICIH